MILVRSLLFNALFYANLVLFLVLGSVFFFTPRLWSIAALKIWARSSVWLLRTVCGIRLEVTGLEHIPKGAVLVAGKHQSLFETFALLPCFADPAMVMKRELAWIPLFGWFSYKFRMIRVARGAGASALKSMLREAGAAKTLNRQIIIFPEGTRRAPGAEPAYKPGAAALYAALDLPCVPFALNSGRHWPRRSLLRFPGTVTIAFLPAIPAGLPRREFAARLEREVETATRALHAKP